MNPNTKRQSPEVVPHDRFVGGTAIRGDSGEQIRADSLSQPAAQSGSESVRSKRRLGLMSVLGMFIFLFIADLGVAIFVDNERYVYYYDGAGWWDWSKEYMALQSQSVVQSFKVVLDTIKTRDQNLIAAVPIGTWMRFAGDSRMSYQLAVTTIYGGACLLALMGLVRSFWNERESKQGGWIELVPVAVLLLVPVFWQPLLRGYIETGGMAMAMVVLWLYFSSTRRHPFHPAYIAIGVLLAGLFLFRRWYAYWIVGFLAVATIDRVALAAMDMRANGFNVRRIARFILPLPVMGLVASLVAVSVALPMIRRVLGTNYADIYSAYNYSGGILANIEPSFRPFGWLSLLVGLFLAPFSNRVSRNSPHEPVFGGPSVHYRLSVSQNSVSHVGSPLHVLARLSAHYLRRRVEDRELAAESVASRRLAGIVAGDWTYRVYPDVRLSSPPAYRTTRSPHAHSLPTLGPRRLG